MRHTIYGSGTALRWAHGLGKPAKAVGLGPALSPYKNPHFFMKRGAIL